MFRRATRPFCASRVCRPPMSSCSPTPTHQNGARHKCFEGNNFVFAQPVAARRNSRFSPHAPPVGLVRLGQKSRLPSFSLPLEEPQVSQNTQTNRSGKTSWVGNKTSTLPIIPDVRPLCLTITYDAARPRAAVATKVHSRNRQQPSPRDWPMSPLKTTLCSPTHQTMRTPAACGARTSRASVRSGHTAVAVLLGLLALVGLPGCWYGPMLADPTMPWPPAPAVAASPIGGAYYDPPAGPPAPPPATMLTASAPQPFDASALPSGHAPSHDAEKQRQIVRKSQSRYTGPPLAALQGYEPRILHWQSWNDEPPLLPILAAARADRSRVSSRRNQDHRRTPDQRRAITSTTRPDERGPICPIRRATATATAAAKSPAQRATDH